MKHLPFLVLFFCGFLSCKNGDPQMEYPNRDTQIAPAKPLEEHQHEPQEILKADSLPTDLVSYFSNMELDALSWKSSTDERDENLLALPLAYWPIFEDHVPNLAGTHSGVLPIKSILLSDAQYLLLVAQQDDYGPVDYVLRYDQSTNKILQAEPISWIWGDAGDAQISTALLTKTESGWTIKKSIRTCHADLELSFDGGSYQSKNEICDDSTSIIVW